MSPRDPTLILRLHDAPPADAAAERDDHQLRQKWAEWKRAQRERQSVGRGVLTVEVDLDRLPDALVGGNFLHRSLADDRAAIKRAVEELLDWFCKE